MSRTSLEGKKINLIPFPDGSFHNHPQGSDDLSDPESLKSRFNSFLNGEKSEEQKTDENVVYKDFSDVPKPTNLDIETEEKDIPTAVELAMNATDKYVEKNKNEESSHFVVPTGLVSYIDELVAKGRPLKYLQLDLKESTKDSNRWKKTLGDYRERAVLDEEEYEKAVSFLNSSSSKSDIPSAVDIAMKVTDRYLDEEEKVLSDKAEVEKQSEEVVEKVEPAQEGIDEKLEEARNNFAEQVMIWEKKIKESREVFQKLIAGLGVTREVPVQEEPVDLVEARESYIQAKKDKYKPLLEKGVTEMRPVEGQILNLREIKYEINTALAEEIEREQDKLALAFESLMSPEEKEMAIVAIEKFNKFSSTARIMLSDMLASGTTLVFGKKAGEAARAYSGYRMDKVISSGIAKVDGIQKRKVEDIHSEAVDELKTNIDEVNLLEREQRFLKVLEEEKNLKKKQRLVTAGLNAITGIKKEEVVEVPVVSTKEEKVPESDEEKKVNDNFIWNDQEIAHEKDGILVLDDKFQDGKEYKEARSAFAQSFDEKYKESLLGTTPIAIPFENGKIHIITGTEETDGSVKVLLNGKEIASGPVGKVKLVDAPGIKSGWFFGDTVYERAFKQAQSILKTLKKNK